MRSDMPTRLLAVLLAGAVLCGLSRAVAPPSSAADKLPRFTEEREAAALFFVNRHLPEILPLLMELKKKRRPQYEHQIREAFAVSEMLADLKDHDPKRYDLELEIWKTEHRAGALAAKLCTCAEAERSKLEASLRELVRQLIELDVKVLDARAEQLGKELAQVKKEQTRLREEMDKEVRDRFNELLKQGRKEKN
jgi:signal recognition particle GTPase